MDEQYLRTRLKEKGWFKEDFSIDQIIDYIKQHEEYKLEGVAKERKSLLKKASKVLSDAQRIIKDIEVQHPSCFENIEESIRLRQLLSSGIPVTRTPQEKAVSHDDDQENILGMLRMIESAIVSNSNKHQKSATANMLKRSPNGSIKYYYTNRNSINFRIIFELERLWEISTNIQIIKSADSEFMIFLSMCLYGCEDQSDSARKEFSRFRSEADHWGQKRT
jgi:hypothetical protein